MSESRKKKSVKSGDEGSTKRRVQRSGSNVFTQFSQHQCQEFKEAFQFIDQDKDGIISKNDISKTFDALGRMTSSSELEEMVKEAPGPINFTTFLSIFGERIAGTDDEPTVLNAFNQFNEGDGKCREDNIKRAICTFGNKFSNDEWKTCVSEAPIDHTGRIDLTRWAKMIVGREDDEVAA